MKVNEIAGKKIKINARTITVLNDAGKTAGMVTGVETFYSMSARQKYDFYSAAKRAGVEKWSRLFFIDGRWYYIADDSALARAKEWETVDGPVPREKMEQSETAAVAFGATVIRVKRADDTREVF